MPDPRTAAKELQGQILDTIRKSQEAVTDAIRNWAETVQSITPSLPAAQVPFADKLPKPSELVSSAYDFAEQLLAAQRRFAEDVIAATAPVLAARSDAAKGGAAKGDSAKGDAAKGDSAKGDSAKGDAAKGDAAKKTGSHGK